MNVRVLTALGIVAVALPLLIFSQYIIYPIALGMLAAMAVFEVLRVLSVHKIYALSIPAISVAALMPVLTYDSIFGIDQRMYILILALVLFAFLFYTVLLTVFSKGRIDVGSAGSVFMLLTYITAAFSSMGLLRYMENGEYIFALVFVGAWVCDTFAYFTGVLLGKHKLIPELSPKKTVEGSLGGIGFTVVAFVLYGLIVEKVSGIGANYPVLALSGLLLSVVAQLGDLFASLIKREHGIKDYSRLLPGHGGIMDRFDSILAVSAALMIICQLFEPFSAV